MLRRFGFIVIGMLVLLMAGCVLAYLLVGQLDLGPVAARRASAAFDRTVTIAGLHVTPGRWLTIDLDGVRVANLPGGSQPIVPRPCAAQSTATASRSPWSKRSVAR